jgi:hypothetical protein
MPTLTPVDYDPFAQQAGPKLVPVDGDPFAQKAPKKRSALETYVTRPIGQAARYTMEGLGGTVGIFSDPLVAAPLNAALGSEENPYPFMSASQFATRAADKMGLPKPEGAFEEVVAGASRTVAGASPILKGGQMLAQAPGTLGRVGTAISEAPVLQGVSAATGGASASTAEQMGASPGWQAVAGLTGAVAPSVGAMTTRGLVRGGDAGRDRMLANIETYERAGTGGATVGQAAGNRRMQWMESLLGKAPGSSGVIAAKAESQQASMANRARVVADSLSTRASPEQAGRGIREGVVGPDGFMSQFRKKAAGLYDKVDAFVPPDTRIPVSRTKATLDQLASPTPGAEATSTVLSSGKIADIRTALDADLQASLAAAGRGELPYQAMKQLRTRLGELIADSTFATDMPTKQLRQIYGAISDDMTAAATATGKPEALRAAARANNFYKLGMRRMEVLEQVVERNGGGEKIYASAMSGTREGGTVIRAVMQSLPEDAQKQVAAAVVKRMGRAKPGQQDDMGEVFSSETFLTNWNNLSKEAKQGLFSRFGEGYVQDLNALAKASAGMRAGASVIKNGPGTAAAGAQFTTAGAFVLNLLGVAGGSPVNALYIGGAVGGTFGTAKAMTNPRVVKWLAQQTSVPVSALPIQIARLKAEAQAKGDREALEFANAVERSAAEQPANR